VSARLESRARRIGGAEDVATENPGAVVYKKGGRAAWYYDETGAFSGTWRKYKADRERGAAECVVIKTRFTASLLQSFISWHEHSLLLIPSATCYAETPQHNCLCFKRCCNHMHRKTDYVQLKCGICCLIMNYNTGLDYLLLSGHMGRE
jgi:hypothetical protein